MPGSKKPLRVWTFAAASDAVPYVRVILGELRMGFVRIWHLYVLSKKGDEDHDTELLALKNEGIAALEELAEVGVLPYERATRGIGLFPFIVDDAGKPRQAYFVFKDSRDSIDSYVFNDELCFHNDLFGYEKPVPQAWKQTGAVPKLEEVKP